MNNNDMLSFQQSSRLESGLSMNSSSDDQDIEFNKPRSHFATFTKLVVSVVVVCALIAATTINKDDVSSFFGTTTNLAATRPSEFSISVSSESPGYSSLNSLSMLPWDMLLEPYRTQYLVLDSLVVNGVEQSVTDEDYTVEWSICAGKYVALGANASITVTETGACSSTVAVASTASPNTVYTYTFYTALKYVRREVRTMTDSDRTSFFSAMNLMYTVDSDTGKELYGDNFNTAEYYAHKHLNGAGVTDCDHWHDGGGILTHHMAFTLQVEQTIQAIDPSLSMPYWEYGMDTYLYDNWWESPIFGSDWFGEEPTNSDHVVSDGGMWEGIEVPDGSSYMDWSISATGSLNPFVNGYSQMRTPWNNNFNKAIGRHNQTYSTTQYSSMPTCGTLNSCFDSTSLANLNDCLNGATHGPVHILIGGSWNEGDLFDGNEDLSAMVQNPDRVLFFKVLWRMGWTRCPTSCDGVADGECACSVPDEYIDTYGAYYILESANVISALSSLLTSYPDENDDFYLTLLRSIEDPGIVGEMFSSNAAYDPTFWPLHGAMERLIDLKRIYISQGEITDFDETWGFKEYSSTTKAAYLDGKCDWSSVTSSSDLTLPNCTMGVTCFGHNEDDLLEFAGFLTGDDAYTNADFYTLMHPWSDDLPYTYDTFDYDYCESEGSDFDPTRRLSSVDSVTTTEPYFFDSDVVETSFSSIKRLSRSSGKYAYNQQLMKDPSTVPDSPATTSAAARASARSSASGKAKSSVSMKETVFKGYARASYNPNTFTKRSLNAIIAAYEDDNASPSLSFHTPVTAYEFIPTMTELNALSDHMNSRR